MTINGQTIAVVGSFLALLVTLVTLAWKGFKWLNRQKEQDKEIKEIREKHEKDQKGIQEEQTLIVYGLLACLKGLKEQGCNGPVTKAINKIEKHLNQKAHCTEEQNDDNND